MYKLNITLERTGTDAKTSNMVAVANQPSKSSSKLTIKRDGRIVFNQWMTEDDLQRLAAMISTH